MSKPSPSVAAPVKPPVSASGYRISTMRLALIAGGLLLVGGALFLFAWEQQPAFYTYRIVKTYPHDPNAYTQGLLVDDGYLIEGTGKRGRSSLRRVDLETGRVVQKHDLHPQLFGEGVTIFGDRIYQLTWKAKTCIVYDRKTFKELGRFRYEGEGWGLTHDGTHLIMSDGTSSLQFRDPQTFKLLKRVWVKSAGRPVAQLNELEYIDGEVYANVWKQDRIIRIDAETGDVIAWISLEGLYPRRQRRHVEDVLNGIAYDPKNKRLFVTGKNWPKLFEIELVPGR